MQFELVPCFLGCQVKATDKELYLLSCIDGRYRFTNKNQLAAIISRRKAKEHIEILRRITK